MPQHRIFITGDTHGNIDIGKVTTRRWPEQKQLTRKDILIVCGDMGCVWDGAGSDRYVQRWWSKKPFTVCFVDGNHENHERLNQYPVEQWNGGKIHRIGENIIHMMRGQVFRINGKTFYTMGGAHSIDKAYRTPYVSWWPEEVPSASEWREGFCNVTAEGDWVDFVITHEGPAGIVRHICRREFQQDSVSGAHDAFARSVSFGHWFFGHHHVDVTGGRYTACFDKIHELVDDVTGESKIIEAV